MRLLKTYKYTFLLAGAAVLASCAGGDNQGLEYAPNMYHSVAYEPLKQITDETAGDWVSSLDNGTGEYYSSNPLNANGMNMRTPPANTVKRNKAGYLPYRLEKDDLELAAETMKSPLPMTAEIEAEGKILYSKFCDHCHGDKGIEPGLVGEVFLGVPAYNSAAIKNKPEGHLFHVITHGKGRMGAHASQLNAEERWKIVRYVQTLQKQ
jgi:mono/diheme cytochrome c family protein